MNWNIDKIYLSVEQEKENGIDYEDTNTDVVVRFDNGETFVAAFFTYKNIETVKLENRLNNRFLNGKYFWAKQLVIIDNCNRENVKEVIEDLLEDGDFQTVFRKL